VLRLHVDPSLTAPTSAWLVKGLAFLPFQVSRCRFR
jgi:hypothetical protein